MYPETTKKFMPRQPKNLCQDNEKNYAKTTILYAETTKIALCSYNNLLYAQITFFFAYTTINFTYTTNFEGGRGGREGGAVHSQDNNQCTEPYNLIFPPPPSVICHNNQATPFRNNQKPIFRNNQNPIFQNNQNAIFKNNQIKFFQNNQNTIFQNNEMKFFQNDRDIFLNTTKSKFSKTTIEKWLFSKNKCLNKTKFFSQKHHSNFSKQSTNLSKLTLLSPR